MIKRNHWKITRRFSKKTLKSEIDPNNENFDQKYFFLKCIKMKEKRKNSLKIFQNDTKMLKLTKKMKILAQTILIKNFWKRGINLKIQPKIYQNDPKMLKLTTKMKILPKQFFSKISANHWKQ